MRRSRVADKHLLGHDPGHGDTVNWPYFSVEQPANVTSTGLVINSHGPSAYNRGCRCDVCRASNAARKRKRWAANKKRPVPEHVEHGAWCYTNWGCRCDICTAAWTEKNRPAARKYVESHKSELNARNRARNDKSAETATRRGYQWTGPELELAGRKDLTASQVAAMTGRTLAGVMTMRKKLRNDLKIINLAGLPRDMEAPR